EPRRLPPIIAHLLTFFFQSAAGIRDLYVTGVQTCALPISPLPPVIVSPVPPQIVSLPPLPPVTDWLPSQALMNSSPPLPPTIVRSEERRVGKSVALGGRIVVEN